MPSPMERVGLANRRGDTGILDTDGQRSGYLFLEMKDASQIPAIAEPWFLALNARVEIHPVMVPGDLAKAGGAIEAAAKKYG